MSAPHGSDWDALKSAFTELADLDAADRERAIARIAAADGALAERLQALLDADAASDARLARFELLSAPGAAGDGARAHDPLGLTGRTVAHFRVHDVLGQGGMGVAYRAEDMRLGRSVALKFLLPQFQADADASRRFLHEARTASALDHPNVCTLLEIGDSPCGLFLAMPAYAGETLQQRLAREGRIPPGETVSIIRQVLQGLAAAHAAGVTHRDLKPGNVMLTPDGTVKILDFGLARGGELQLSAPVLRAGTIAYMSPEQLQGDVVDPRSDLWAAGIVLHEMLTGERPFGNGHDLATVYAILHEDAPPVSARAGDVPPGLEAISARLLRRDPAERWQDATQVIAALDALDVPARPAGARLRARRRVLVTVAIVLLAGAGAAVPLVRRELARANVPAERASVAVLPFADTSPARDQGHLGEGVAEEILNALLEVPGLRVPARGSSFAFGSDVPVAELARRLQVAAVLEGSVHRAGDRVRITARLLDARSGRYLWSQTFDRRFRDIFAVQAEIARTVAQALEVRLSPPPGAAAPTQNVVAYELYLRGLFHWNRRTSADLRQAIDFFTQAAQHDTAFAQPYAGLALSYVVLSVLDPAAVELLPRTHEAAARALALDSTNAQAHAARGYAYHWQWQWADAGRELERAIALDPNYATARQWYGEHLAKMGRTGEGERQMRRAIALDPLSLVAQNDLAIVLLLGRRYAEAIAQLERVQRMDPSFPLPLLLLHRIHLVAGNAAAAADAGRRWAESSRLADPAELELLAYASQDTARRAEARAVLARWERASTPRWPDLAMYYTLIGDEAAAIRAVERGLEARAPMMVQLKVSPWLDPLRDEPRFQAALRKLAFP